MWPFGPLVVRYRHPYTLKCILNKRGTDVTHNSCGSRNFRQGGATFQKNFVKQTKREGGGGGGDFSI